MSALPLHPEHDPAGSHELHQLLDQIARLFNLTNATGEQTIELRYEGSSFRWARIHSGRLGIDGLPLTPSDKPGTITNA